MPHVSKKKLNKTISRKLWNQLLQTFKDAGRRSRANVIVGELFTPTERVMFAKRLFRKARPCGKRIIQVYPNMTTRLKFQFYLNNLTLLG